MEGTRVIVPPRLRPEGLRVEPRKEVSHVQRGRMSRARAALLALLAVVASIGLVVSPAAPALAANCGDVLVAGSAWAGGSGVDVHSNGASQGTANDCAGVVRDLNAKPPQYGDGWQCVELAVRMYMTRGWVTKGFPDVLVAADIVPKAASMGMSSMAQGSIDLTKVVPGDMVVSNEHGYGHVVVVDSVDVTGNIVNAVEQNASATGRATYAYDPNTKKLTRGSYFTVTGVVHSPNNTLSGSTSNSSSTYSNGTYITSIQTGAVYVMAGGSPLRVASWANVGGTKPVTSVGQPDIDAMAPYPADGTYVQGLPSGRIFVFAGGAPLAVSSWNNVGAHPFTGVDDYAIDHQDHTRSAPVDGTYVNALPSGRVYVFAGGAPLRVANWNNVGGVKNAVGVDDYAVDQSDHMNAYPADGTYVNAMPSGRIMVFAGGAALQVAAWGNVGGVHGYTTVDDYPIDHPEHVRAYPADGTTITGLPSGSVYVVAGGAPMRVANWGNIGGVRPFVSVDDYGVAHQLRPYPQDNTYVVAMPSNRAMVFAGGSAMRITSWSNLGGVKPYTTVDDYTIDQLDHVRAIPADGTVVAAWPGGKVYMVAGGAPLTVTSWASIGGSRPYASIDAWALTNQLRAYPMDGTIVQGYTTGRQYHIQGQLAVVQNPPLGGILVVDDWAIDNQLLAPH